MVIDLDHGVDFVIDIDIGIGSDMFIDIRIGSHMDTCTLFGSFASDDRLALLRQLKLHGVAEDNSTLNCNMQPTLSGINCMTPIQITF